MPIYEFRCDECGERFEELVAAGTDAAGCPACHNESARRVMSVPASQPRLVKTAAQNRRLEGKRGVTRGGALQRFKDARRSAGGSKPARKGDG